MCLRAGWVFVGLGTTTGPQILEDNRMRSPEPIRQVTVGAWAQVPTRLPTVPPPTARCGSREPHGLTIGPDGGAPGRLLETGTIARIDRGAGQLCRLVSATR